MKSTTIRRFALAALMLCGAQTVDAQSQADQGNQKMDHSNILSTIETNNAAVAAGDIAGILATYEPNAVLLAQPGMPVTGSEALREAFKQFTAISPKITIMSQDLIQTGDIALHSYTWKMSGKTPDGHPVEQRGFSLIVLRKQPDGRWLMVIDNPFGDQLLHKN